MPAATLAPFERIPYDPAGPTAWWGDMRPYLFLIPLFPLLGFLFNFTIGVRVLGRRAGGHGHDDHGHGAHHAPSPIIGLVAAGSVLLSFLVAAWAVVVAHATPEGAIVETLWTWLPGGAAETAV